MTTTPAALLSRRAALGTLTTLGLTSIMAPPWARALLAQSATANGRLTARPVMPTSRATAGLKRLGIADSERDGLLFVPTGYRAETPVPLMLLLHGAGQRANELMDRMQGTAEEINVVLVAPDSRGMTWDVVRDDYGPDVAFIDRALKFVFSRVRVDPARVSIAGFSDGASYALSIGRINGDLFRRIGAFSPGFVADGVPTGKPRIYVSHGLRDQILSVDNTRDAIVPSLKKAGYAVEYHEFDGPHRPPPDIRAATRWLAEP